MMNSVEIDYGMDKLIDDCGTIKVNAAVSVKKLKEKNGNVENLSGGNYDFPVLGSFLSDVDELNYGVYN